MRSGKLKGLGISAGSLGISIINGGLKTHTTNEAVLTFARIN
jgi:hypothetical protein